MRQSRAQKQLAWATEFARMNLDALRPGDWSNLRDDMQGFFGYRRDGGGREPGASGGIAAGLVMVVVPDAGPYARATVQSVASEAGAGGTLRVLIQGGGSAEDNFPEASVRHLQARLREWLTALAVATSSPANPDAPAQLGQQIEIGPTAWQPLGNIGGKLPFLVSGRLEDVFLLNVMMLIRLHGPENVRSCAECGGPFWRVGRKLYCARPCASKASFRAWLNSPKGKTRNQREAKAARDRYRYKKRVAEMRSQRNGGVR